METIQDPKGKIAGYIFAALDLEDKISGDVYNQYMERKLWPEGISDKDFEIIKACLATLISETNTHIKAFESLKNRISNAP